MLRRSCAQLYEAYLATGGPEGPIVHPPFQQHASGEPILVDDGHGGQTTVANPKAGDPKTWDELTVPEKHGAQWLDSLEYSKEKWDGKANPMPIRMPPEEWSKDKWERALQAGPIRMGTPLGPSLRLAFVRAACDL